MDKATQSTKKRDKVHVYITFQASKLSLNPNTCTENFFKQNC